MKVIFGFQDVQEVIEAGITPIAANATETEQTAHRALKKKDFKAMFFIHECVDLVNFQKTENATSAKECWDIFEKGHFGNDKLKQSISTRSPTLQNQMKSCGSTISDGDMVEKVIGTSSSKFDYIIVAIMEAKDVSTMKLEELQCSLKSHEQRINPRAKSRTFDQALWTHTSKKGNGNKHKCKDQFKKENSQKESSKKNDDQGESSKSDGNGKSKKFINKKNIQCYNCQKYGHFASECRNKKVPRQYNNKESEANMAHDDSGSETDALLMMTITSDDDDEKGQWKWDTASTDSQSTVPFIFEDVIDENDTPQVTATIEPEHMSEGQIDLEHHYARATKSAVWRKAMEEEIRSIERNNTWELVSLPAGKKLIAVKYVYKVKHKPDGTIAKYKARLVAKEFLQKPGIDFNGIFVPVARLEIVRLVVAIANHFEWDCVQLDVKSAFLNDKLEKEVYVEQPQGFIVEGKENNVLKLNKVLYGLKQAPS
ncbi:hypothetical protein TSUD_191600 [Trifolium subterraneum]|uniref:CCHC-type domain-containing protein n=1 Tax=Trifolium subterraneum TaxID=3900 RepID=A0A2Z6ME18_TRISU|nr:hypothetical protein TSUD_191600 [Trifolium subterraneum]